jgi:exodeoxyribonuclease III
MDTFKIATWNVNSLRVRLSHVLSWLGSVKPQVLAIQEIKLVDADFPLEAIEEAGYHVVFSGQKTYNGMAVLSHADSFTDVIKDIPDLLDTQRRLLAVTVNDIRIINLYVPNGESITSQKYQYKLNWLTKLIDFLKNELIKYPKMIVLGDFNIAPAALDIYDPVAWEGKVLYSEPERQLFDALLQLGLHDCFRKIAPDEKCFSWWDYRLNAFKRNMGARIDHILASHDLSLQCIHCHIDKTPRGWERPSDHAPVIAEFSSASSMAA